MAKKKEKEFQCKLCKELGITEKKKEHYKTGACLSHYMYLTKKVREGLLERSELDEAGFLKPSHMGRNSDVLDVIDNALVEHQSKLR